jgi:hypothetical protein
MGDSNINHLISQIPMLIAQNHKTILSLHRNPHCVANVVVCYVCCFHKSLLNLKLHCSSAFLFMKMLGFCILSALTIAFIPFFVPGSS